jgi:hypothetical protein
MGLGSGIRDPEKTYSGSRTRGQKGTGSRIRIRNTGHKADYKTGEGWGRCQPISCTVIRFLSTSAKFDICIVVGLNRTLVEDKMRT